MNAKTQKKTSSAAALLAKAEAKRDATPYRYMFEIEQETMQDFIAMCKKNKIENPNKPGSLKSDSAKAYLERFITACVDAKKLPKPPQ